MNSMRFGSVLIFLVALVLPEKGYSTIDFLDVPTTYQFFQRNSNDQCAIDFTGSSSYQTVRVKCYKRIGSASTYTFDQTVNYTVSGGNFAGSFYIDSELTEWEFQIYGVTGGIEYFEQTVSDIVCGETFVVCGQSNAVAPMDYPVTQCDVSQSKYARSFGPRVEADLGTPGPWSGWGNSGAAWSDANYSGGWALRIQKQIIAELGVPIGVVNVAVGSTGISEHFSTSADIQDALNNDFSYNIWEGMMARLEAAGIKNSVKTIFWYQGEDDTPGTTCQLSYYDQFLELYDDWHTALPALEQIYLFQLSTTCNTGEDNSVNSKRVIRDTQLRISEMLSDVQLITTFGVVSADVNSTDNCHYTNSGECKIGSVAAPMYAQYVDHTINLASSIYPPRVLKAVAGINTITLTFDKSISVVDPNTGDGITINHAFYDEAGSPLNVTSNSVSGANLTLIISGNMPKAITYLPNSTYNGGPSSNLYFGPWIMNSTGTVAASSYFKFPVISSDLANAGWFYDYNPHYNSVINACSFNFSGYDHLIKQSITIGCTNSVPTSSYEWLRVNDYFLLNGTFTVPVGSTMLVEIIPDVCP